MNQPIIGYRVFFPDPSISPEDFSDVMAAWERRCEFFNKTGVAPYVHPLREGGPEFPVFS